MKSHFKPGIFKRSKSWKITLLTVCFCLFLLLSSCTSISGVSISGLTKVTPISISATATTTAASTTSKISGVTSSPVTSVKSYSERVTPSRYDLLKINIEFSEPVYLGIPSEFTIIYYYQQKVPNIYTSLVQSVSLEDSIEITDLTTNLLTVDTNENHFANDENMERLTTNDKDKANPDEEIQSQDMNADRTSQVTSDTPEIGTQSDLEQDETIERSQEEDDGIIDPDDAQAENNLNPGIDGSVIPEGSHDEEMDPDQEPLDVEVRWDWESDEIFDTEFSSDYIASHTYSSATEFTITAEATDGHQTATTQCTFTVQEQSVPCPPEAIIGYSFDDEPGMILFDGSGSTPKESITSYMWDFGDGSSSTNMTVTHYFDPGDYTVTLTVIDDQGETGSDSVPLTIDIQDDDENHPPVAIIDAVTFTLINKEVLFDGSSSYDPDHETGDYITSFSWDFGDGTSDSGSIVYHTFTDSDTFTVTLTVKDRYGKTDSATHDILVAEPNQPPIANASGPYYGIINQPVFMNGSASCDSDGEIIQYNWDFGDGTSGEGMIVNHTYNKTGTYILSLVVTDVKSGVGSDITYVFITNTTQTTVLQPAVNHTMSEDKKVAILKISFPTLIPSQNVYYKIFNDEQLVGQTPVLHSAVSVSTRVPLTPDTNTIQVIAYTIEDEQIGESTIFDIIVDPNPENQPNLTESDVGSLIPIDPITLYIFFGLGILGLIVIGIILYRRRSNKYIDSSIEI